MIRHRLSLAAVQRRVIAVQVSVDLPTTDAGTLELTFPVWTPGSYLIREHPRHVNDFGAHQDGRPLTVVKTAKNTYRISTRGSGPVVATYEVYAHELTVRTSHVDSSHAFLNPVGLVPFIRGREAEQQQVEITVLPQGWDVACPLPAERLDEGRVRLTAASYDELIDSPIDCGPHTAPENRIIFKVRGVPHELVFWGRSSLDRNRFATDVAKIVEAEAAFFGGLPYDRYVFFVLASDFARGGLEHRASSALLFTRASLLRPRGYEDLLGLVSHELFHAWNVKRIKPTAFTPYDLTRENHTRLLWAFEGLTSYYEDLFLLRAGLMTRTRFLELLAERLTVLERTVGRRRITLADAGYDAWIRYYRQDENTDNSSVSYYLKGSLVGALLDIEIRRATSGAKSLDDVMRLLWEEYGRHERGLPEQGVEDACVRVGGPSLRAILQQAIHSTEELPLPQALESVGLKVERRVATNAEDRGGAVPPGRPLRCDVGISLRTDGDRVRVAGVRRGSPADEAGLCPGDEILAIDGLRADTATSFVRLHDHAPGDPISLALFRRDELLSLQFNAGTPALDTWSVSETVDATTEQRAGLTAWLGVG